MLLLALTSHLAAAKGGPSYLTSATISGGGLRNPVTVSISIPDTSYELVGIHVPTHDYFLAPPALADLEKTPMPYGVALHYDYGHYGGKQDKIAHYDGDRLLAFTNAVGVTDWYQASPALAGSLQTELFWPFAPLRASLAINIRDA